mgnify:CR=1 FL=1|tara:strand:- start:5295 stop:6539 length:1245 start_codon:yes stop_codon:yes gene_type:complete
MGHSVAVIGAGIAGLRCALLLKESGIDVQVFDRQEHIGGRMVTERVNGFLIDHGFHVMQTAYPTSQRIFDFESLGAQAFEPGAIVVKNRKNKVKFWRLADPFRRPFQGLMSGLNGFTSPFNLLRVALLRAKVRKGSLSNVYLEGDDTSKNWLSKRGFSSSMIDDFFHPLFSGIFLENELRTSERMFRFVFRMMSKGDMILPREGIAAAPNSLADSLGFERIHLNSDVKQIDAFTISVNDELQNFDAVICAYNPRMSESKRHVWTLHFDAEKSPLNSKHILLNGDLKTKNQLIAHVAVPSDIQPSYAPNGRSLVTVTIVGEAAQELGLTSEREIQSKALQELRDWFGSQVDTWDLLATQHIEHALPEISADSGLSESPLIRKNSFECGDHMMHGSLEGALLSAEKTAKQVLESLT